MKYKCSQSRIVEILTGNVTKTNSTNQNRPSRWRVISPPYHLTKTCRKYSKLRYPHTKWLCHLFWFDDLIWFLYFHFHIRWLKPVSSTFQDVDFDGSLLPLFIIWCYNHGIKKTPQSLVNTLVLFSWHCMLP